MKTFKLGGVHPPENKLSAKAAIEYLGKMFSWHSNSDNFNKLLIKSNNLFADTLIFLK